jgi:hypothetical protein
MSPSSARNPDRADHHVLRGTALREHVDALRAEAEFYRRDGNDAEAARKHRLAELIATAMVTASRRVWIDTGAAMRATAEYGGVRPDTLRAAARRGRIRRLRRGGQSLYHIDDVRAYAARLQSRTNR